MTLVVVLLILWVGVCLLVAGLLWGLAGARVCVQVTSELVYWLRDQRTPRPIRIAVALLILGPTTYALLAVGLLTADLIRLL